MVACGQSSTTYLVIYEVVRPYKIQQLTMSQERCSWFVLEESVCDSRKINSRQRGDDKIGLPGERYSAVRGVLGISQVAESKS